MNSDLLRWTLMSVMAIMAFVAHGDWLLGLLFIASYSCFWEQLRLALTLPQRAKP